MTIKLGCSFICVLALMTATGHAQPTTDAPAGPPAVVATPPAAPNPPAAPDSSPAPAPPAAATPAAPAPSASVPAPVTGSIAPPPTGKGQVVFFRPSGFVGMAVWFNVRENGVALGKLSNGTYFVQVVDPGPHTYTAATENKNVLHLEIDDGETYYVRGSTQMGVLIAEADMTPSDQATFEKAFKRMHLAKPPAPAKPAPGPDRTK